MAMLNNQMVYYLLVDDHNTSMCCLVKCHKFWSRSADKDSGIKKNKTKHLAAWVCLKHVW